MTSPRCILPSSFLTVRTCHGRKLRIGDLCPLLHGIIFPIAAQPHPNAESIRQDFLSHVKPEGCCGGFGTPLSVGGSQRQLSFTHSVATARLPIAELHCREDVFLVATTRAPEIRFGKELGEGSNTVSRWFLHSPRRFLVVSGEFIHFFRCSEIGPRKAFQLQDEIIFSSIG